LRESSGRSRYALRAESFQEEAEQSLREQMQDTLFASDITPGRRKTVGVEEVEQAVVKAYGISRETLYGRRRHAGEAKGMALELCCRLMGMTQRAVGVRFGYGHESAVGKQRRRIAERLAKDQALARRFDRLASSLNE
jgi:chromosomal replication initiation ATPase DnaA